MCNYITNREYLFWSGKGGWKLPGPGFEISITFESPVGGAIYHMLTCLTTVIVRIRERCRKWDEASRNRGSHVVCCFGSPLATCRAALLATSIGIHIQCPGFSTIFPPWNSYFSVFLSAIYYAFRFFSINCLSCQLCTQLKTTLNYVFCFTEKFRRTRNTKAES